MKREILCTACYPKAMKAAQPKLVKTDEGMMFQEMVNPPEHRRFVHGTLTRNCYCDSCGLPLEKGSDAVAASYWLEGQVGFVWEGDYVEEYPIARQQSSYMEGIRDAILKEPS